MSFKRFPDLEKFKYNYPLQVRWDDLDPLNHVNNVVYGSYFQFVRGRYFPEVISFWNWEVHMFVIANLSMDYYRELGLKNNNPKVWMRVSAIGTKSFTIEYLVSSEDDKGKEKIHTSGTTTQVMFDMKTRQTYPIPEQIKQEILAFEKQGSVEVS